MPRLARSAVAALFAAGLAGCNQTASGGPPGAGPDVAPAAAVASLPPGVSPPVALSEETGCAGDVSRFRAVLANDVAIGHLSRAVYSRANADVNQAAEACSAGREHQARMIVFSAKRTYGYP